MSQLIPYLLGAVVLAGLYGYWQTKRAQKLSVELWQTERHLDAAQDVIKARDFVIERMEQASEEARKKHEEIRQGTDLDRFNASVRILRDG